MVKENILTQKWFPEPQSQLTIKAIAALADGPRLVPSTHGAETVNFSSRASDIFWLPQVVHASEAVTPATPF